ncbi:MAG: hypothetical protein L0Z62_49690 [Gemmataceae bacterium]|nr:hypothetical protein [Gemmataceae bacterium]
MRDEQIVALAADFWHRAGVAPSFPRDLAPSIPLVAPIGIVCLAGLRPWTIQRGLLRQGVRLGMEVRDRPLDGCLVAWRGQAVIFLDAALDAPLARVILGHEVGHYLADYERPRVRALRRLGPSVLPILDGERRAGAGEELAATLADVPLGAHVHYLDRSVDLRAGVLLNQIERTANELSCELLAPRVAVWTEGRDLPSDTGAWERLLVEKFGFPAMWACDYARRLLRLRQRRRTFSDHLGLGND